VVEEELPRAAPGFRELSLTGPRVIAARRPEPGAERSDAMLMGVSGIDVGQRPIFWEPYENAQARALERARPIATLLSQYPGQAESIRKQLADINADPASARFLPVMARTSWVAVLDKTGILVGYLPLDGFF